MRAAPLLACVGTRRSLARPPPRARLLRCRQQNVDIMLQNLDKTEALENKSADLANQAKTCAASPTTRHELEVSTSLRNRRLIPDS